VEKGNFERIIIKLLMLKNYILKKYYKVKFCRI